MKTKLLVGLLLAGSSMFAETRLSIGIGTGGFGNSYYAPAPPVVAYRPAYPGPGYSWVDGYWYNAGPRRLWRSGYWAPPVVRAQPRYNSFRDNRGRDRFDNHDRFDNRFDRR